jgi:hypothetical protein
MSRPARSSTRARNALHGYAPSGVKTGAMLSIVAADGRTTKVGKGSTMNFGGNAKSGLFPTVGVSYQFLNLISNCCRKDSKGTGVNILDTNDVDQKH